VEYPLWYAYFLGVCAVLMGLCETRFYTLPKLNLSALSLALILIASSALLLFTLRDYLTLETWLAADSRHAKQKTIAADYYRPLVMLSQDSLMQSKAVELLAARMPPTPDSLDEKRRLCAKALRGEPLQPTVFTCALLDEMAGDTEVAEKNWRQALAVFRSDVPAYLETLRATMPTDVLLREQRLIDIARAELAKKP
ncbi:MAG TPA: Wzy polymerase domain-containing protein, partial [Rhodocyclaceae bacterium]|nr:Wzy polymerase domain-containing protein [Rhodocyclaceae bacterium]